MSAVRDASLQGPRVKCFGCSSLLDCACANAVFKRLPGIAESDPRSATAQHSPHALGRLRALSQQSGLRLIGGEIEEQTGVTIVQRVIIS